jgi:hypothetical protein
MHKGRGGMGMKKHAISGHRTKSPRFRHNAKREAEAAERKRVRIQKPASSVKELLEREDK